MDPFEDEHAPLFTVGQVAEMLAIKQAFLRRVDELRVVSPQRSAGNQRRYTRYEVRVIQQVVTMADEGMTLPAIRRIIDLEEQLAEATRQLAELGRQLAEATRQLAEATRRLAEAARQRDELANRLLELPPATQGSPDPPAATPENPG